MTIGVSKLEINAAATISFLESLADRLDRWASESRYGGWSTHQVSANESAANDCRRMASVLRAALGAERP